jgi:pyruvate carboxylase subunit B
MAIGNEEVIECRPADLIPEEMDKLRKDISDLAKSEEDTLTYAMFPDLGREYLEQRAAGTLMPEPLEPADTHANGGKKAATEFNVSMHGETYHVKITGKGYTTHDKRPYYITIDGVPEEVLLEPLEEISLGEGEEGKRRTALTGSGRPRATEPGHVTTSMPGNIVDVLVKVGDAVKAGDPVLITEAMKMETEIQAPVSGVVTEIHVKKGESVTPDETLIEIE